MFWRLRKLSVIIVLVISCTATASEKATEHGAAKEGAEGEAPKADAKSESKDSYIEAQNEVSVLQAKIKTSEENILKLIEEKQHAKEAAKVAEIIKNLVTEHKGMEKNIEQYEKARSYLQYRFPEKGLKGKRTYQRFELKSLEEMEREMTMDTRLKKTLNKVRKQYGVPEPAENEIRTDGSFPAKKPEVSSEISEPVILSK